ncbi:hypothetical protein MYX65_06770 [Acidobacteria bacterium AH-259-L09]|nr:hypothetical protein [Acidobacteria bacterium AH-259-L09]
MQNKTKDNSKLPWRLVCAARTGHWQPEESFLLTALVANAKWLTRLVIFGVLSICLGSVWAGVWVENPQRETFLAATPRPSVEEQQEVAASPNAAQQASTRSSHVWLDAEEKPLPFQSDEEIQEFLRTARVVSIQDILVGVTKPKKVLLEKDGIRMHAKFNNVKIDKRRIKMASGRVKFNFRDDAIFNCAAYELSKLLGLDNVPPVVERKIKGQGNKGILQAWVEKGMVETERLKNKIQTPEKHKWRWTMQYQVMRLFDNLIYNEDPNQGNILYDQDWKLWMIDHTRAFRTYSEPLNPTTIRFVDRKCWEKLQNLNEDNLKNRLKPFLHPREIKALLKRRDKLVEHIQQMIAKRGEGKVLFTLY